MSDFHEQIEIIFSSLSIDNPRVIEVDYIGNDPSSLVPFDKLDAAVLREADAGKSTL